MPQAPGHVMEQKGKVAEAGHLQAPGAAKSGVHLRWENVKYTVDVTVPDETGKEKPAKKDILQGISGHVAPGQMLAIMGPSGCGKSSLLNILARRKTEEDGATGDIHINGSPLATSEANYARLSGYVTQAFVFFEFLTVKETLMVSAKLTLPKTWTTKAKEDRVDRLLRDLDLTGAAETMIGSASNPDAVGISGGERRRLCMAMELMNDPPLLFLDEPTSGLDSASALMVVQLLKRQAEAGKTVVCVIHQPRASILPLFDSVLLIGKGKTVYYGPSCNFDAETDPLRSFFTEAGYPCPAFENPADHILDIINTAGDGNTTDESLKAREATVEKLCAHYGQSPLCKEMSGKAHAGADTPLPAVHGNGKSKYATSWFTQFGVLIGRTLKLKLRDPMSFATVLSGVVVVSVLEGSIYWQIPMGDWQNRIAAIAMFVSFMAFMCFDILMLWPAERTVYLRDQRAGMYSTSAFYIARSFAELPIHMLTGILGGVTTYYMYGMGMGALEFAFQSGLMITTSAAVFMAVSSVALNFEQSNQLAMPILTILFLFSGFFVPANKIPVFWKWVPDVNYIYYSVNYLVVQEVHSMDHCDGISGTGGDGNSTAVPHVPCNIVLRGAGFDPDLELMDVLMCHIATNVIFRILAYVGLRFCWTGQSVKQRCAM